MTHSVSANGSTATQFVLFKRFRQALANRITPLQSLCAIAVLAGAAACTHAPKAAATTSLASAPTSPRPTVSQAGAARYNETPNQYVDVEGTRIAYRVLGSDAAHEPPLVLLCHFTCTMDDWDPEVIDGLARGRRVFTFDSAGVGASGGTTPETIQEMAHVAEAFVDAVRLGTVDILGFSMGGAVAQQFLIDRPSAVRKAILAGTVGKGAAALQNLPAVVDHAFKRAAAERKHPKAFLFFNDTQAGKLAADKFVGRINKHTVDPAPLATQAATQAQMKAILAWGGSPANTAELAAIKHPVLIVNGSEDVMAPTPESFELYKRIPHSQLVLYPDSGHGAIFQYHDAFVQQVDAFLRNSL